MSGDSGIQVTMASKDDTKTSGKHKCVRPHGMVVPTGETKQVWDSNQEGGKGGYATHRVYLCQRQDCKEKGTTSELGVTWCGTKPPPGVRTEENPGIGGLYGSADAEPTRPD